ncbi:cytochrome P450, partial [Rhizopogon vinicolor AM-OR11-026]
MLPFDGRLAIIAVLPVYYVLITLIRQFIEKGRHRPSLPPGPMPLPLLGSVLSINTNEPWLTYTKWCAAYGDLVFVRILDEEVVVINSQQVAEDLLDKRSRIYSDRPYIATLEPFGWTHFFGFEGYNDVWRLSRRIFHQTFRASSALKFRPMQIRRARQMIANLIDDPQHYNSHFATFSSSVAMSAVYNYEPSPRNDPLVRILESALDLGIAVMIPEKAIVLKTFPFLLKLPDWCWGSSIKRDAQVSTDRMNEMIDVPFRYAQQHMVGIRRFLFKDIDSKFAQGRKHAPGPIFNATTALTTSTLMVFFLAMVLYPDIQKRAQAVIDSVIGKNQ